MSVTAETSQPAMGPYVAVALFASALYAAAAVFREAWSVNNPSGGEGGGGK